MFARSGARYTGVMTQGTESSDVPAATPSLNPAASRLLEQISRQGPFEAVDLLLEHPDELVVSVLTFENPAIADEILWLLPEERRNRILEAATAAQREQWSRNHSFPEDSVGRLMSPPTAVLRPDHQVKDAIERLRPIVKKALVSYGWVVDEQGRLVGVLVFRELLFAQAEQRLDELMVKNPFSLRPELSLQEAMREALRRHFPVYPVCDESGRLLGILRGENLFEQQAFELSAQAGTMVGVEKEERLATPWSRSLKFRHPWLQLNLFTAFIAAAVVGVFQDTLDRLVVLAVFLPVLAGQSGNTGCQALAVALRGMTLGELDPGKARQVAMKEGLLGLLNGGLVGLTAAAGMLLFAKSQGHPAAWTLALVVLIAMIGSCTVSGISGAVVPVTLKRLGADPATASSIFLTTATDVVSMGMFLALASWLIP